MTPSVYRDELIMQMGYEGFELFIVSEGQEVLKKLKTNSFDMIVTQLELPQYDGLELILNIRDLHITIPIIVVSFGKSKIKNDVIRAGASVFLRNPVEQSVLIGLIKSRIKIAKLNCESI